MWLLLLLTLGLSAAWYFRQDRPWLLWTATAAYSLVGLLFLTGTLPIAASRKLTALASILILLGLARLMYQTLAEMERAHRVYRAESDGAIDAIVQRVAFQLREVDALERERFLAECPAKFRDAIAVKLQAPERLTWPQVVPGLEVDLQLSRRQSYQGLSGKVIAAASFGLALAVLLTGLTYWH